MLQRQFFGQCNALIGTFGFFNNECNQAEQFQVLSLFLGCVGFVYYRRTKTGIRILSVNYITGVQYHSLAGFIHILYLVGCSLVLNGAQYVQINFGITNQAAHGVGQLLYYV